MRIFGIAGSKAQKFSGILAKLIEFYPLDPLDGPSTSPAPTLGDREKVEKQGEPRRFYREDSLFFRRLFSSFLAREPLTVIPKRYDNFYAVFN